MVSILGGAKIKTVRATNLLFFFFFKPKASLENCYLCAALTCCAGSSLSLALLLPGFCPNVRLWSSPAPTPFLSGQQQLQPKPPSAARELVLDYVVERKRMPDLCSSIIDGRFREQKVPSSGGGGSRCGVVWSREV